MTRQRSRVLRFAFLAFVALGLLWPRGLLAATGIVALDESAIPVKSPGAVMLDAITRAGGRLVAVGEHGVIAYSDDNGGTWRQAAVPVDATLTAVAFLTPLEGWAAGNSGVILHSADGGATWREQLDGLRASQLTLAAAQAVSPTDPRFAGAAHALHRADVFISDGPCKPFLDLLPFSASRLFAFGAYRMTMFSGDGGAGWQDWSLHIGDPFSHHLYDSAVVGSSIFLVGEAGLVFRSDDGGESFPAVTPAGSATLYGVGATGDGILVYGVAGLAYKSVDAGKSWTQIAVGSDSNLMAMITLPSGAIVLAAESGTMFISHDHGSTFKALATALPMALYGFTLAPDGDVVAVGNRGAMVIAVKSLDLSRGV